MTGRSLQWSSRAVFMLALAIHLVPSSSAVAGVRPLATSALWVDAGIVAALLHAPACEDVSKVERPGARTGRVTEPRVDRATSPAGVVSIRERCGWSVLPQAPPTLC